ncbi:GSK3-beta interaction protein [Trichoplax sp. H2]|uniref:GSKIP domain-containing protein n=1 Tax=Trichoplax adhaerens TaxID=10228 RepID=B3RSY6_TRIAD|nr:hypothetical protein TRIADDRAFT_54773 [Trichoplax adhaerens]EDV26604.1 hypothetical protein TRIADDRAFT_54773 [Trichoplax adhaerens]RDD45776.1 GSK3-beta interaction protein [Trichoplax sp. H2]|eukprot:XP_002110600.1 hypothetical protein TRIADDRAFT_54773 [Trichoplax adhaerens]
MDASESGDIRQEALAIMKEIAFSVKDIHAAKSLPWLFEICYINVITQEGKNYCIEVTASGWRIVGYENNKIDADNPSDYYETLYSLLDNYSPLYRESFGQAVIAKLNKFKETDPQ